MTALLLTVSAIGPSLFLVWYFHARDVFREPPRVLWTTFFLGILIVAPVLLFAWPMHEVAQRISNPLLHGFVSAFFSAAIPEEVFKWLVLWGYAMRHSEFDEPMDGIVYGATASLGFATFENILYVSDGGLGTAFMRAITAVPGHAFLGVIMGDYIGRARFAEGATRRSLLISSLAVPILLHGAYDMPLMAAAKLENPDNLAAIPVLLLLILVPIIICLEWIWAIRLVKNHRLAQLPPLPVASGSTPEPQQAEASPALPAPAQVSIPAPASRARRSGHQVFAWIAVLGGGLIASIGILLILMVALGLMIEGENAEEVGLALLGTFFLGVLPAATGSLMFVWGIRRLNRAD